MDTDKSTACTSTRAKLMSLIEDIEIVSKELLEFIGTARPARPDEVDADQLIALLKLKDEELQKTLLIAKEQGELQKRFEALHTEVEKRDQDIRLLQRSLKEIESILATAIYQAKQKLQTINQASNRKISSEELIKYAHKISASNAVAAPPTWAIGDPRRPYPTELDMRISLLNRMNELPVNSHGLHGTAYSEFLGRCQSSQLGQQPYLASGSSLTWQPSAEVQSMTVCSGIVPHSAAPTTMDAKQSGAAAGKDSSEDVELMSSDSSSSSSSDE